MSIVLIHNSNGSYRLRIKKDYDLTKHNGLSTIHAMRVAGVMKTKKSGDTQRSDNSIKRTRARVISILSNNLDYNSYFMTLTFAEEVNDYQKALKIFNKFVIYANRSLSLPLKYVCMKELQKTNRNNVIHYHLILFSISIEDVLLLKTLWYQYGIVHLKKITDLNSKRIANYVTSYITDVSKNQLIDSNYRLFTTSNNLKKPIKINNNLLLEYIQYLSKYDYDSNNLSLELDIVDYAIWCFGANKVKIDLTNSNNADIIKL